MPLPPVCSCRPLCGPCCQLARIARPLLLCLTAGSCFPCALPCARRLRGRLCQRACRGGGGVARSCDARVPRAPPGRGRAVQIDLRLAGRAQQLRRRRGVAGLSARPSRPRREPARPGDGDKAVHVPARREEVRCALQASRACFARPAGRHATLFAPANERLWRLERRELRRPSATPSAISVSSPARAWICTAA